MALQLSTLPAAAHAPPQVTGIFAGQADDGVSRQWLRTNRGVILKNADSEPLRLLCNDAYKASLSEVPPMIAAPDGLIVGSYTGGLLRLTPDGCDAQPVDAPLGDRHLADLATTADAAHYLALVAPSQTQAGAVLISSDAGHSWSAAADVAAFGTAMLSAPSDPNRIYISAVAETADGSPSNQLLVSSDGAKTFTSRKLALKDSEVRAYALAIDPLDADRLFMRPLADDPEMPERLLLSEDAGETFAEVYSAVGPLVFTIDEQTAWLGGKAGVYRSDDRGKTFEAVPEAPGYVGCLRPDADGLLVCGHQGNEFGIFRAASAQGPFSPYVRFGDVTHQVACGDRVLGLCQANFDDWMREFAPVGGGGGVSNVGGGGASNAGGASNPPLSGTGGEPGGPARKARVASGCSFRAPSVEGCVPLALVLFYAFGQRRRLRIKGAPPSGGSARRR